MMLNVPKKANDAMHLSLVEGCDVSSNKLGEVVLQDAFSVWDPKQLIRKGRERHIFLFELYLLFTKEVKDSAGKVKYIYKNKLMVSQHNFEKNTPTFLSRLQNWESPNIWRVTNASLPSGQEGPQFRTTESYYELPPWKRNSYGSRNFGKLYKKLTSVVLCRWVYRKVRLNWSRTVRGRAGNVLVTYSVAGFILFLWFAGTWKSAIRWMKAWKTSTGIPSRRLVPGTRPILIR